MADQTIIFFFKSHHLFEKIHSTNQLIACVYVRVCVHEHMCTRVCVCAAASCVLLWSPSVHQSPERVSARHLVCLSASHFLCLCVCLCVCCSQPVSPYTSSSPLCVRKNMLSLSLSPLSAPNQCLIGLIPPPTMDKLFLEIPVMKRLFPSLLCLAARPVSLFTLHTHRHICNWRLKCFKDSAVTLLLDKTQNPRTRLKELYKQCSAY